LILFLHRKEEVRRVKLAMLGGSFNPVHIGHLFLADSVLTSFEYDRLILVPVYRSPFKPGARGGSPEDRLAMLASSITGDHRLSIDDCEIRREGVSYTIDTLTDIIRRYRPEGKLGLVLGDDLAGDFPKWRQADEIAELTDIIIARRFSSGPVVFPYPHQRLENEIMEISSADVRERIEKGGNWRYLVPQGARVIIEDHALYIRGGEAGKKSPSHALIVGVEEAAWLALSPSRFFHSRYTALLCRDLCLRFGLDPASGYLVGIAHDMCKSLKTGELLALAGRDGSLEPTKSGPLLHGRAAAVMLRERFGVEDPAILEAVRLHTTGDRGMGDLAKVLYIADKIEISRNGVNPKLRELARSAGLEHLFEAVFDDTIAYLRSKNMAIAGATLRLYEAIHGRAP
jgi:nicotinate-nucleotide adenylyltransferase